MNYISTRGNYKAAGPAEAIMLGMVPRGGLFIPENIPVMELDKLKDMNYIDLACEIIRTSFRTGRRVFRG